MIRSKKYLLILFALVIFSEQTFSQESDTLKKYETSGISIISDRSAVLGNIPGSAVIIDQEQLRSMRSISGNQILRTMTGINVVDEEGAGLRMNMGIRGLDPDRSRALLVLEDGIPVALAPYGEPELYYTPSIDRMSGIEVLKGSGSIIYGPQTIGGVLNYITSDPPIAPETDFHFTAGGGGLLNAKVGYGASQGATGFMAEMHHKRADRIGITNYNIYDFMAKAKFTINERSSVSAKLGVYDESSNSTYVGLTQNMYDAGNYFQIIAPNDELNIRRYSASLNYQSVLSESMVFNTSVFAYSTSRFWRRQDFSRNSTASNQTGTIFGDTSVAGGAIYMRNSTGNRDRAFDVFGIQPQLISNVNLFGIENEVNIGARFLIEKAFEQRINGTNFRATSGNLVDDEIRTGVALSAFIQDRIHLSDKLVVTPGIRFEHFNYERDISRISSKDTSIIANQSLGEFIPGLGINYNFNDRITLFAGTHRGFAPPRTKDAITNQGAALDLAAELSWNYELGLRSSLSNYVYVELTAYMLDFSNQVIPVAESAGGLGFGLVNGGSTMHRGLEFSLMTDIGRALNHNNSIIFSLNGTYTDAKFNSDRFIGGGDNPQNINGNRLPYAPEYTISSMIQYKTNFGIGMNLNATYVGQQFTDELNTLIPSSDGTIGLMPEYYLVDFTISYELNPKSDLFISVKNLTDERYIATRRPQGIRAGIPRLITFGIDYHL
ncbi:MAG: TonB-dependent receptor [Candidatus Kapabacteria bacterium]|nr:TonB-dependent receptor [Ignavibacteriota bacterium]MCW5883735.1 TonB-dependent receptor [Candidatus Kapabacteria bacterium]